jgi:hypothetical protein
VLALQSKSQIINSQALSFTAEMTTAGSVLANCIPHQELASTQFLVARAAAATNHCLLRKGQASVTQYAFGTDLPHLPSDRYARSNSRGPFAQQVGQLSVLLKSRVTHNKKMAAIADTRNAVPKEVSI